MKASFFTWVNARRNRRTVIGGHHTRLPIAGAALGKGHCPAVEEDNAYTKLPHYKTKI